MIGITWSKHVTGSTIWSNVFSRWRYNVVQLTVSRKSDRKLRGTWEQVRHETTRYTYLQHLEKFCCICMATLNCHVPWSPLMERKKFQLSMWRICQSGLCSLTSGSYIFKNHWLWFTAQNALSIVGNFDLHFALMLPFLDNSDLFFACVFELFPRYFQLEGL